MHKDVFESFNKLKFYCEKENFKGWDPFDGLNSVIFNGVPFLNKSRWARLLWIQLFKRSPLNLRKIAFVPKDYNPKGLGLFLSSYCKLYRIDPRDEYLAKINMLSDKLIKLRSPGYSGACWGYNFDWQSKAFFQPKYTPTVVASTFIGYALLDAYDITKNEIYKTYALSVSDFILKDLNRTTDKDGDFAFSYSPLDNTQVFNASLLGSRMLARAFNYSHNKLLLEPARKSIAFCCKHQKKNGSWPYSTLPFHQWIDNFHTGFNLECLYEYQKYSGDNSFDKNIKHGLEYYLKTFFTEEGIPKYYNNKVYPVDIHSTSQLVITLDKMEILSQHNEIVNKVIVWTINNMQHSSGYFYYQKNKNYTNKIPFMRWTQSWMFYAMTSYLYHIHKTGSSVTNKIQVNVTV